MASGIYMTDRSTIQIPGGGRALAADLFRPAAASSLRTAVILLHGGAWRFGSRAACAVCERSGASGFTALAAEYRLLGEAAYPAQLLDDVRSVIAWAQAHAAELGIDPGKIALEGFSAGGHLALLAAATPHEPGANPVAAVVSFFAPALSTVRRRPGCRRAPRCCSVPMRLKPRCVPRVPCIRSARDFRRRSARRNGRRAGAAGRHLGAV